eukprot:6220538-Pyramimonas_sp.AAC.1
MSVEQPYKLLPSIALSELELVLMRVENVGNEGVSRRVVVLVRMRVENVGNEGCPGERCSKPVVNVIVHTERRAYRRGLQDVRGKAYVYLNMALAYEPKTPKDKTAHVFADKAINFAEEEMKVRLGACSVTMMSSG